MAQVPNEELNKAIDLWLFIQATQPAWAADYIKRHDNKNPFEPWPPEKKQVDEFMRVVNDSLFHDAEPKDLKTVIDPKKREQLIDTFNKEYEKTKNQDVQARGRAQELIRLTLENKDVRPDQKDLFYQVLKEKSADQPSKPIETLVPEAVETGEIAQVFLSPKTTEGFSALTSHFKDIKNLTPIQKAFTAPLLDAITTVFPGLKQGVMNKSIGFALEDLMKKTDNLTKIFGSSIVSERWYQDIIKEAGKLITTSKSYGGARTIIDDVASSLFRGPTSQTMIAYVEVYRLHVMKGLPPPSANQFIAANMGVGSKLFKIGVSEAKSFAVRKGLTAIGGEALAGIFGGPPGWVVTAFSLASGLFSKFANWFKGLIGVRPGEVPGDRIILIVIGVILLLFFIPIFPFLNFQAFNQLNIDSSLVTRFGGQLPPDGGQPQGTRVGPIVQTAPISGPLQCFNTTTNNPLSGSQVNIISSSLQSPEAKSLGLYNCLLNCPQNTINLHAGGKSSWYGWSTPGGDITFYDGLFATNNHDRVRNIAHELAHQWAYSNPNIVDQFQQEGYCGRLCTYPSGYLGKCSSLETVDETFAESAAMYLVGENLQSLCPKGYNFMNRMFTTCGGNK